MTDKFMHSTIVDLEICFDCDRLIGLGFANFDAAPDESLYPATWVYERIYELAGLSYLRGKRRWLNEVVHYLEGVMASGCEAIQDYQRCCKKTPEQALRKVRKDIVRVERLLGQQACPQKR